MTEFDDALRARKQQSANGQRCLPLGRRQAPAARTGALRPRSTPPAPPEATQPKGTDDGR